MAHTIKAVVTNLVRLAILWLVDALSLAGSTLILPGIAFFAVPGASRMVVIVAAALLLAFVNLLIRPIILLLARPLGWIATLVVGLLVNAAALWITAWLLPGFEITLLGGLLGAVAIGFFNTILTGILDIDDEGSWYQNRVERLAREDPFAAAATPGLGLMMVEIDGLSYWHIKQALDDGLLPTLQAMIDEDGYQLSLTDCGLPSMTSSCQAGIMFGDNHDIPAYRWYDKRRQKLFVSASDATELNARYARGQGLMRDGSSIMNMMNGDAQKSMFTMANMFEAGKDEKRRRANDITLLMLNPYFLTRALALFVVELGRELWEAWQQRRHAVQPRLNRLEHWYPFVRAAMCSLMRDISANLAILDMMRGAPAIYMLYLGYDEVAHHSGPWTDDAFGDLTRLDHTLGRLRRVVKEKAPRPYELIILSDHGQSFGPTFKQRYGLSIKEFIEAHLPVGTTVAQQIGGDTGAYGLQGMAGELANVHTSGAGTALDRSVARQGHKLATKGADAADDDARRAQAASVTAYGSGNAAQVYFDLLPRKIKLSELHHAYPGLIDAVVHHPGIGLVAGYADDDTTVVLGKEGSRNLHTGQITGVDPLIPYAPATGHGAATVEKRAWQVRHVMDFPSAGDLWLISTVYPDGTVAALEELIGSHGGVGGEQTDAFIFHPPAMSVPETRNSTDVFHILNQRRGVPVPESTHTPVPEPARDEWTPATLRAGISQVSVWVGYAVRCLFLDRSAYAAVTKSAAMTGPALLIALLMRTFLTLVQSRGVNLNHWLADLGSWLLGVLVLTAAGYLLTRRGRFTTTFRAVGFAQSVYIVNLLAFIPGMASVTQALVLVLGFVATWMGGAVAHETRGWKTLLLPILSSVVLIAGVVIVDVLLAGADFTWQSVLFTLGIRPTIP